MGHVCGTHGKEVMADEDADVLLNLRLGQLDTYSTLLPLTTAINRNHHCDYSAKF